MNLPNSFISVVRKYGIAQEDIIFAAMADFDVEYRFANSIAAITKEKLILAAYPYQENAEYDFGGYGGWQVKDPTLSEEPAVQIFELENAETMEVIRQVATGLLMVKIDGVERNLCHFSNTRMESFLRICRLFEKLKKGEEITKEDLDVKRGKECCPKCGMIYPDQERKICPKCMDKKSILQRVMGYFKPYKKYLAVMVQCYLGTAVLT